MRNVPPKNNRFNTSYIFISTTSLLIDNGTVTSLISRDEFYAMQSRQFVEDTFEGSLPAFLAAFTKDRALTAEEAAKIRKMIDEAEGGKE